MQIGRRRLFTLFIYIYVFMREPGVLCKYTRILFAVRIGEQASDPADVSASFSMIRFQEATRKATSRMMIGRESQVGEIAP